MREQMSSSFGARTEPQNVLCSQHNKVVTGPWEGYCFSRGEHRSSVLIEDMTVLKEMLSQGAEVRLCMAIT